ncbi:hypothetical protein FRC08_013555 [Ceratobasidium sp. 394]|nr:hypothetical protein FRC08_013555 [Ceratobasidium sp. 394]
MFSTLSYPVEQPYRIRWITDIFYAGSAVLIVVLVIFNLVVSGYDTVTVITQSPNITDPNQWWAPDWVPKAFRIIRTAPGECEPAVLPLNTPLGTNSSLPLFSYILSDTLSQQGRRDPYKANPLDSCRVQRMTMVMEAKAIAFDITITLSCNMAPDPTRPRQFVVHFKNAFDTRFRHDTIIDYMALKIASDGKPASYDRLSRNGPPKDKFFNVLGVVDALSGDLAQLMRLQWVVWLSNSTLQNEIPGLGYVSWASPPDAPGPASLEFGAYDEAYGYYFSDEYLSYFRSMNATVSNIFVAIRDAIYLDVGYVTPTNIYVNKAMFNSLITPDSYFTEVVSRIPRNHPDGPNFSTNSWGWGVAPGNNASWAQALTSTDQPVNNITLPIVLPSPLPPSVIDIMYLCPQYQLKSWGSLFIALFTGTFATYASLYGLFAWLAPILDQKRHGPQPLELLVDHHTREMQLAGSGPLVSGFKSSKSSLDLESSVKEHLLGNDLEKHP